jgi:hypothetical protein
MLPVLHMPSVTSLHLASTGKWTQQLVLLHSGRSSLVQALLHAHSLALVACQLTPQTLIVPAAAWNAHYLLPLAKTQRVSWFLWGVLHALALASPCHARSPPRAGMTPVAALLSVVLAQPSEVAPRSLLIAVDTSSSAQRRTVKLCGQCLTTLPCARVGSAFSLGSERRSILDKARVAPLWAPLILLWLDPPVCNKPHNNS